MVFPTDDQKPRLTEEAQAALNEFLAVFKDAAESGPDAFAMIAAIGKSDLDDRPQLAVRVFKQGSMNPMACYMACMQALEKQVKAEGKN